MEAAQEERELAGDKAQRIVDAMRRSVAERGAAASTFEHVAKEAGVSRGLLHYYFGTKERLLVEVVRGDAEIRMERLNEPLAGANSVDDILEVLVANLNDLIENDPGFFCGLFELFSAGRQNTEIREGVGALYSVTTDHVAGILAAKDAEGVLSLRFGARAVTASLFAMADGFALQVISNPDSDHSAALESLAAAAKHLLDA